MGDRGQSGGKMRFGIGEFSRMTTLTIKSLRLYHEKGLLVPDEVDDFTGYRYYSRKNFETARSIRILKSMDFSLAEIRDILDEFDDESEILDQLENKLLSIRKKIQRYESISLSIEQVIQQERESDMKIQSQFEVEEKDLPTQLIAGHRMRGKYSDAGKGITLVAKKMGRFISGKPFTLYHEFEYKEEDADFETCFPVRKGQDNEDVTVRELPGAKAATLIHKGPYDTLHDSYQKLFAYTKDKDYEIALPLREVYLKGPGMIFRGNPKNYLTELQFVVKV